MPIYEYRCEACGHTLDALQKISDEPLRDCPECSAAALKRLISAPSFRLKGSGWYETDFKSDKERKRNLADMAAGDAGGKSEDKSPDGDAKKKAEKPESKPESKTPSKEGGSSKPAAEKKASNSSGTEAA